MLVKSMAEADCRELAGEVDSLQEGEEAEEKEGEGEGGSRPVVGSSPSTTTVTSPRSCLGGPHQ